MESSSTIQDKKIESPKGDEDEEMKEFHDARSSPSPSIRPTPASSTSTLADAPVQSQLIFAFGPSGRNFFYSKVEDKWKMFIWGRSNGHAHNATFKTMGHTYAFAFSPHGDEFAAYKDSSSGAIVWSFSPSNDSSSPSYQTLRDWLEDRVPIRDETAMSNLKMVFGPGASYYASAGGECLHHDLPSSLVKAIEERKKEGLGLPEIVALGGFASKGGTYLASWEGGKSVNWSLNTDTSLYELVEAGNSDQLADVYMSPIRSSHFVAVKKDGNVTWSIPGDMNKDTYPRYLLAHMQRNAQAYRKTYKLTLTGTMEKHTLITPETNYTFDATGEGSSKLVAGFAYRASSDWLRWMWNKLWGSS